jgi:hypothetical protein
MIVGGDSLRKRESELDRIRTCDPRLKRALLYLLSYQPDERKQTIGI